MSENNTQGRYFRIQPVTERLTASGNVASNALDEEQPVLMEARLMELINSLRQLITSNEQLDDVLQDSCDDEDLLDALRENERVIASKREESTAIQQKLSRYGVNISLDDKIPHYSGSKVLQMLEQKTNAAGTDDGLYL